MPQTVDIKNHLLIVDDEPRLTSSFKVLFENKGFTVKTATDGYEAIEIFKSHPSKVVISDIQMDRMDGIQLMHELKQIDPCIQIIFLTGYTSIQSAADALKQNNAFEYLAKPVKNMDELYSLTKRAQQKYDLEKNLLSQTQENEKGFAIFSSIFDSMEAIVYVSDIQTYDLIYTNKKFLETFNEGQPILEGQKCWQVVQKNSTEPCPHCTNPRLLQADGKPGSPYEWEFQNPGNHHWYNLVDKAIEWYDKRIVRLQTAFDITEKKEHNKLFRDFEKAIDTSKKLESISTLAGGVAHDFNNSLSMVIGNINLAQLSCNDSETQKYLRNAENGIMQAKGVSSKLISFARGGGPVKVKTDIEDLVRRIIEQCLRQEEISYNLECEPIPADFYADQSQLKSAFQNIFQNAIESIKDQGHIDIAISYQESPLKNPQIFISITDTGSGISKEHLDMIFNPYFTTKPMGNKKSTGLGLSIAWSTIARHGGLIHTESSVGQGTTVHISLPVFKDNRSEIQTTQKTIKEKTNEASPSKTPVRVLVMDDDELILDVISQLLTRLGYETFSTSNGNQAINVCQIARKQGEKIQIALLDFEIHNGLGGFPTMEQLKKIDPDIKGLLITGHSDDMEIKRYKKFGFSNMIEKPFSIKQLNQKIKTLL